ncbi:MAG: ABC transporter permease subunit [Chitinophagaceae bacterium]
MFSKTANRLAIFLLFALAVLPLLAGIGYALLYSLGVTGALKTGFTFEHWKKLFTENNVLASFLYSAAIAAVSLLVSVSVSLWIALTNHQRFRKGALSYLIYLPLAFPGIVAAFFFFQFLSKSGILSRLFFQLHITHSIDGFPDLTNDRYGIGMIVTHCFLSIPFFVLLFVNFINTERITAYLQLSATLGAGSRKSAFRVAIPMLLRKSLPNIILYFIFMFGAYEIPVLLGRSNPETVSVMAVRKLQKFNLLDIPQGYAIAILYTVVVFSLIVLMLKSRKIAYDL